MANDVGGDGAGFAVGANAAVLIDEDGEVEVPLTSKRELAERIWDRVAEIRRSRARQARAAASGRERRERTTPARPARSARAISRRSRISGFLLQRAGALRPVTRRASTRVETRATRRRLRSPADGARRQPSRSKAIRADLGDCQRCKLAGGRKNDRLRPGQSRRRA